MAGWYAQLLLLGRYRCKLSDTPDTNGRCWKRMTIIIHSLLILLVPNINWRLYHQMLPLLAVFIRIPMSGWCYMNNRWDYPEIAWNYCKKHKKPFLAMDMLEWVYFNLWWIYIMKTKGVCLLIIGWLSLNAVMAQNFKLLVSEQDEKMMKEKLNLLGNRWKTMKCPNGLRMQSLAFRRIGDTSRRYGRLDGTTYV